MGKGTTFCSGANSGYLSKGKIEACMSCMWHVDF